MLVTRRSLLAAATLVLCGAPVASALPVPSGALVALDREAAPLTEPVRHRRHRRRRRHHHRRRHRHRHHRRHRLRRLEGSRRPTMDDGWYWSLPANAAHSGSLARIDCRRTTAT